MDYKIDAEFPEKSAPHDHGVQFYESDASLIETVGDYLANGLVSGARLVVVTTHSHTAALTKRLAPLDIDGRIASQQLRFFDAHETLAHLLVNDSLDSDRASRLVREVVTPPEAAAGQLRVFGEMVDLLVQRGNPAAAERLENIWNEALRHQRFSLLCAYDTSHFRDADSARWLPALGAAHSHVIASEGAASGRVGAARPTRPTRALAREIERRRRAEVALLDALAREERARDAVDARDALRGELLELMGRDLRQPLHTMLSTARLMVLRGELSRESEQRLANVVASGERRQRMLEQMSDLLQIRLAAGLPVRIGPQQDLGLILYRVVEQVRVTHPGCVIDVQVRAACVRSVDAERFEQVLLTVIGNAAVHGEPGRLISVCATADEADIVISVHNFGAPISPELRPQLFEPKRRGDACTPRADGLGVGLPIAAHVVRAHGGQLEVDSCAEHGTRFRIVVPQELASSDCSLAQVS